MLVRVVFLICCFVPSGFAATKELKVAMGAKLPPMHFIDTSGKLVGFEVDLVNLYAKERGLNAVIINPAQYNSSSLDMVSSGKADMAVNCIAITEERKQQVVFSDPYFSSGAAIITGSASIVPFDFYKRTYIVIKNSLYAKLLAGNYLPNIKEVSSLDEALSLLEHEKLPKYLPYAFVHDWTALRETAATHKNIRLADLLIAAEEYGVAVKRGSDLSAWNTFLLKIRSDGRYQQLLQKWSVREGPPAVVGIPKNEYRNDRQEWSETLEFEILPGGRVAEYLPILTSDLKTSRYANGLLVADKYYNYLVKHFSSERLPHLEELYFKSYPVWRGKLFYDFVQERDVTDMLASLLKSLNYEQSWSYTIEPIDQVLSVITAKHPEMREEVFRRYDRHLEQRTLHISFKPGCVDENGSVINIVLLPDGKMDRPVTVTISMGQDGDLRVLPSRAGEPNRIMINGLVGTLKEMTIAGDTSVSIMHIDKGGVAKFSLPDDCEYEGMSADGKTMHLIFKKLRLYLDVASGKILKLEIANPLMNPKFQNYAYGKLSGLTYFKSVRSNDGNVYYVGDDLKDKGKVSIYSLDKKTSTLKKQSSIPGQVNNPLIMDNKLFVSELGYDSCIPMSAFDTRTGRVVDTGHCGNMVPVGLHELYYCAPNNGWDQHPSEFWLVNTETLKRRAIKQSLCPGNTGSFAPHPVPGYFLYFDRSLC